MFLFVAYLLTSLQAVQKLRVMIITFALEERLSYDNLCVFELVGILAFYRYNLLKVKGTSFTQFFILF
jgi:hypothetical protein